MNNSTKSWGVAPLQGEALDFSRDDSHSFYYISASHSSQAIDFIALHLRGTSKRIFLLLCVVLSGCICIIPIILDPIPLLIVVPPLNGLLLIEGKTRHVHCACRGGGVVANLHFWLKMNKCHLCDEVMQVRTRLVIIYYIREEDETKLGCNS